MTMQFLIKKKQIIPIVATNYDNLSFLSYFRKQILIIFKKCLILP